MIHLSSIRLGESASERSRTFPFSVPAIGSLTAAEIAFRSEVTFFVGENGSGKSTLLEGIAASARSITVGSTPADGDPTLRAGQALGRELRLTWVRKTRRGFFMRAEDFFGYAQRMQRLRDDLRAEAQAVDDDTSLSPVAKQFGRMPFVGELASLERHYGEGLDTRSHGESFLDLFQQRFVPNGLYLLDEPEAPLSPTRQLSLIAMMKSMVEEQSAQFIIATHSPILMSFPGAAIYSFDQGAVRAVPYGEIEHVTLTRQFLNDPQAFLRHL